MGTANFRAAAWRWAIVATLFLVARGCEESEPETELARASSTSTKLVPREVVGPADGDSAWPLFDRDVTTAYDPGIEVGARAPLELGFSSARPITSLKTFGPSPYRVHLTGENEGVVDLSVLSEGWNTIDLVLPASDRLSLSIERIGAEEGGISELELWGPGEPHARVSSELLPAELAAGGTAPAGFDVVRATPVGATPAGATPVGAVLPFERDVDRCATFTLALERDPSVYDRVFLAFEADRALGALSVSHSFNGASLSPSRAVASNHASSKTLVVPIVPSHLTRGENSLKLCNPSGATHAITVTAPRERARVSGRCGGRLESQHQELRSRRGRSSAESKGCSDPRRGEWLGASRIQGRKDVQQRRATRR